MRAFYLAWTEEVQKLTQAVAVLDGENLPPPVAEIPWGHNILLLEKIKHPPERLWYAVNTKEFGWSRAVLTHQVELDLYRIHIFFLWVRSVDIALERVADRVKMGGHNVPEDVVRRRYDKGLSNFNSIYSSLSDFWAIYDNSAEVPKMVAFEKNLKLKVVDNELYDQISQTMRTR
jgi:hypothetical protein